MLDHLINFEPEVSEYSQGFVPLEKTTPTKTLDAKIKTVDWLKGLGAVDTGTITSELETQAARTSFANIVSAAPSEIT